eukprot:SAG31_NODE_20601_length_570_cov_0.522293_2_plen_127_part_01
MTTHCGTVGGDQRLQLRVGVGARLLLRGSDRKVAHHCDNADQAGTRPPQLAEGARRTPPALVVGGRNRGHRTRRQSRHWLGRVATDSALLGVSDRIGRIGRTGCSSLGSERWLGRANSAGAALAGPS